VEAESEVNWFQPERGTPEPERRAGAHYADPAENEAPVGLPGTLQARTGPIGPRSGQPLPPLPESTTAEHAHVPTETIDREVLHRARGGLQRLGDGVYRGRQPAMAVLLIVLTVLFEVPVIRVFANSFRTMSASGTIAGTLMIVALPMFALGLYAFAGGAAVAPGQGVRAWLRTPLAYLPLGLLLFLIAALAAA
jgi:hypothetical protein